VQQVVLINFLLHIFSGILNRVTVFLINVFMYVLAHYFHHFVVNRIIHELFTLSLRT